MNNPTEQTGSLAPPAAKENSLYRLADELLERGARAWDVSRRMTLAILVAPAFVAASGIVAGVFGKQVYKWLTEEDQLAETLQVGFYGAALLMSLLVVRYQAKAKNWLIAVLYIILTCGLFFLVGEEVSWGQRFFGWHTPETLAALNKQNETNLHNIHGVGHTFKWIQLLVGAYGTLMPLVLFSAALRKRFAQLLDAVIPHFTLIPYFLPMFLWKMYRNLGETPQEYYYAITNYNEVVELILSIGFCLFLVFQVRRCRRERNQTAAA